MKPLFDRMAICDPITGRRLEPIVSARTPAGVPISGALRVEGTDSGYPIVDCIARLTPELAHRHAQWPQPFGLPPPPMESGSFQPEATVASFGFHWNWNAAKRSEADLLWPSPYRS